MLHAQKELPIHVGPGTLPRYLDDGLIKGGMYLLKVQSAPTRFSVVNHALSANLARGLHCTLITHLPFEDFVSRTSQRTIHIFKEAIEGKKLAVFSMIGDYTANIFRYGPQRFMDELEKFDTPHDGFIVVDHADALFTAVDLRIAMAQAEAYRAWMRRTRNSALFLFPYSEPVGAGAGYLQCLSDYFNGTAGLYISHGGLEICIDYWGVQRGVIMAKRLAVTTDEAGVQVKPSLVVNRRNSRRGEQDDASIRRLRFPSSEQSVATELSAPAARVARIKEDGGPQRPTTHRTPIDRSLDGFPGSNGD